MGIDHFISEASPGHPSAQWWNAYVGLPWAESGRHDAPGGAGLDCWGLVRQVYAERLGVDLPGFQGAYETADPATMHDLLDRERAAMLAEGWVEVKVPQSGDVVTLRIAGSEHHVGIVTRPGFMLHVRRGKDSVVERLDSGAWKHRITGYWRNAQRDASGGTLLPVVATPHPLRAQRLDGLVPAGQTLAQIADQVRQASGLPQGYPMAGVFLLDGRPVPPARWGEVRPVQGQRLEVRALPAGDQDKRNIALIAVAIAAAYTGGAAGGAVAGGGAWGAGAYAAAGFAAAAVNYAGSSWVNRTFPIRPPKQFDPGQADRAYTMTGAKNELAPYGAIPVVLGRHRITPPLGGQAYYEANGSDLYMRALLVWGYGPMDVDDIRFGDIPVQDIDGLEMATVQGTAEDDLTNLNRIYGRDVQQLLPGVTLENENGSTVSWTDVAFNQQSSEITVLFQFPQGLRKIKKSNGKASATPFIAAVQWRVLDPDTLEPVEDWPSEAVAINGGLTTFNGLYSDRVHVGKGKWKTVTATYYRWLRVGVDAVGTMHFKMGALTDDPNAEPSGAVAAAAREDMGLPSTASVPPRLPSWPSHISPVWDVCVFGYELFSTVDHRTASSITGCDLTTTYVPKGRLRASVANGVFNSGRTVTISSNAKDPFYSTIKLNPPSGVYQVRVRRVNSSKNEDDDYNYLHAGVLAAVTSYDATAAVTFPIPLTMTTLRVRVSNQLEGGIPGISGTASPITLDWDAEESEWVERYTTNPASIYRQVLQHPANAGRVPDEEIDLPALQAWHELCDAQGWTYSAVISSQTSLKEVLEDIAAAGRASPTRIDGKRSVVVDAQRDTYSQYITPYNSWDFEGVRKLPMLPHGLRVQFFNAEKGWQEDERIVYADGYNADNATRIEGLELPGVTFPSAVHDHARFHHAQFRLRPDTYTVSMDHEHIICTRGDLVRVQPFWHVGGGRVRGINEAGDVLTLTDRVAMVEGEAYVIRLRLMSGESITVDVVPAEASGEYKAITLQTPLTEAQRGDGSTEGSVEVDDNIIDALFVFGQTDDNVMDCIVIGVEVMDNLCARLTLQDYAPEIYGNLDEEIPPFNSYINTIPPAIGYAISQTPYVTSVVSNEAALIRLSDGRTAAAIRVGWENPLDLAEAVEHVDAQIMTLGDGDDPNLGGWDQPIRVPTNPSTITFSDVIEGSIYKMRFRYVDTIRGYAGPWSAVITETVIGKSTPPADVTGVAHVFDAQGLLLSWTANPEIDIAGYIVRSGGSDWDSAAPVGAVQDAFIRLPLPSLGTTTFRIKAVDDSTQERQSVNATAYSLTRQVIGPVQSIRAEVIENNVFLSWQTPATSSLAPPVAGYKVRIGVDWDTGNPLDDNGASNFATWFSNVAGAFKFWMRAYDSAGTLGTAASVEVICGQPSGYIQRANLNFNVFTDGVLTNFVSADNRAVYNIGGIVGPIDTERTWDDGWGLTYPTWQDKIDDGYTRWFAPNVSTATAVFEYEHDTVIPVGNILATPQADETLGTVDVGTQISWKEDAGDAWTDGAADTPNVFAQNFKFVRITVTYTASTLAENAWALLGLNTRIFAKQRRDSGSGISAIGGAAIVFGFEFVKANAPIIQAIGLDAFDKPYRAAVDYSDVPNPTGATVYIFDSTDTEVDDVPFTWGTDGY
jgi:hypothetical protein